MIPDYQKIKWQLSHIIPDMEYGFTIQTNYGSVDVQAEDAAPFIVILRAFLRRQLEQANAEQ